MQLAGLSGQKAAQIEARLPDVCAVFARLHVETLAKLSDASWLAERFARRPQLARLLSFDCVRRPSVAASFLQKWDVLARLHLDHAFDALEKPSAMRGAAWHRLASEFPELRAEIEALWCVLSLENREADLPENVRKLAAQRELFERELRWLRTRNDTKFAARIRVLEERLADQSREKQSEELREALGNSAAQAAGTVLDSTRRAAIQARFAALCGASALPQEWDEDWENATLLTADCDLNRRAGTSLLRARAAQTSRLARRANQNWLAQLESAGKNRALYEQLCDAQPLSARFGELELRIERDVLQILQMGNRFSTCLSLNGCNAYSTIANALDANKIVVYARRRGQFVARQLWCISREWELVGFYVYTHFTREEREKYTLETVFAQFAQTFAAHCGLSLCRQNDFQCEEIGGACWYDDGLCAWEEIEEQRAKKT